jgi:hypothetical protein
MPKAPHIWLITHTVHQTTHGEPLAQRPACGGSPCTPPPRQHQPAGNVSIIVGRCVAAGLHDYKEHSSVNQTCWGQCVRGKLPFPNF